MDAPGNPENVPPVPRLLPPGFRFHPTDEELVAVYLRRKALAFPLPAAVVLEVDLLRHSPWDLMQGAPGEKYFFTRREAKYPNGSRANRATETGYWKATGRETAIAATVARGTQPVHVGMKRTLVFYLGKPPSGERTGWVMHEYCLAGAGLLPCRRLPLPSNNPSQAQNAAAAAPVIVRPAEGWLLCRIFKKKGAAPGDGQNAGPQYDPQVANAAAQFIDFLGQAAAARHHTASPMSSCLTVSTAETSDDEEDDEEETSNGNSN